MKIIQIIYFYTIFHFLSITLKKSLVGPIRKIFNSISKIFIILKQL